MRRQQTWSSGYHLVVATVVAASLLVIVVDEAGAIDGSEPGGTPSKWHPTYVGSQVTNGQSWGDVAHFLKWNAPSNFQALTDIEERTFEIGFKGIHNSNLRNCYKEGFGSSGIPSVVEVKWDYSEDPEDAVFWFADLGPLEADQQANPTRSYSVWGDCFSDLDYWTDGQGPVLQVQRGHWTGGVQEPGTTFADSTMNVLPDEAAYRVFPDVLDWDKNDVHHHTTYAAWNRDHNFEDNHPAWTTAAAIKTRYCASSGAAEGRCYVNVRPSTAGSSTSRLIQRFLVESYYKTPYTPGQDWVRLGSGDGNAMQLQVAMRCRSSSTCPVRTQLQVVNGGAAKSVTWYLPPDQKWYIALADEAPSWVGLPSGTEVIFTIDTQGRSVDLDSAWISSDLVIG